MKIRHLLIGTMLGSWLWGAAAAPAQTLIWAEEFDGPTIDRTTWTFNVGGHGFGNGELQYHTARPENAYIENGKLVIEARRENYLGKQFTSARLTTHGRFAFKYGTLVARVKVPDLQNGLWPAFWLLGNNFGQVGWPASGEIDILEMGHSDAIAAGVVNRRVQSAAHWDYQGNYALYGDYLDRTVNMYNDYHEFKMVWTPASISTFVDNLPIWTIDISNSQANSLEEFHRPFFMLLNLSVGGYNFVNITDPAQITAPFPAKMYVDWVRLYDNGSTELILGEDLEETGHFGVFTDTTPVNNHVVYDADASLYLWNNLTPVAGAPFEGPQVWTFQANPGAWFGMGVFSHVDRNMRSYTDGKLRLHIKTTWTGTLGIGLASSAAGESWLNLVNGQEQFGLVRDGQWHELVIPLNRFSNVDFNTIKQLFMLRGDPPAGSPAVIAIDNVYWEPSGPRPTPQHGNFGIFTENPAHQTAGTYQLGVDGDFYVWENTMQPLPQQPYEGSGSMSLGSSPGLGWFGAAFTPNVKYNLTAFRYPESRLRFALRTTSTTTFSIGMRSGNVDDIGQRWIQFKAGQDPYGFVRDGQWHVIEIPMSDIANAVDLFEVSQLFEILGTDGPIAHIEFDDVCLLGGGAAEGATGPGDADGDGDVDLVDYAAFAECLAGPEAPPAGPAPTCRASFDLDGDSDVDVNDFATFQTLFSTAP
jgi:beta-glucanase (GH16 family)